MKRALACGALVAVAVVWQLHLRREGNAVAAPVVAPRAEARVSQRAKSNHREVAAPAALAHLAGSFAAYVARAADAEVSQPRAVASGAALLQALLQERSPQNALQIARALAAHEGDDALRAQTIAALRAAPEARSVGLLALMGRADRDALQLAADTLASHGNPEAGATAAFVLDNAHADALPDEAYAAARQALRDHWDGARLREETATLLGRPDAPAEDLSLLEQVALAEAPAVRMRALAALDVAGDPMLGEVCDRISRDPAAPDRLVEMARAWRAMHPS